jgi:hypothetical protein
MRGADSGSLLDGRRSVPLPDLGEPGPDEATLQQLLMRALRVPDHSQLTPWRIQVVRGEARQELAEGIAVQYLAESVSPEDSRLAKLRAMPQAAPVLLVVSSHLKRNHKVPEIEQLLSGGALCQNILLAAQAAGFAGFWLTGWSAYSAGVKRCSVSTRANTFSGSLPSAPQDVNRKNGHDPRERHSQRVAQRENDPAGRSDDSSVRLRHMRS